MSKILTFDNSFERHLSIAEQKYKKGDLMGALVFAFNAFFIQSDNVKVLSLIASIYADAGLYELAIEYWFLVLDKTPEEDKGDVYEQIAKISFYEEDYYATGYYMHKKITKDGIVSEDLDKDILEFFKVLETDRLKNKFRIVYPENKINYQLVIEEGIDYAKQGNLTKAIETFSTVPEDSDLYLRARENLAAAYLLNGDIEGAGKSLKQAVKNGAESLVIYCALSAVWDEMGEMEKCVYYYKKALEFAPKDNDENLKLGILATKMEDHENVKKYLSRVVESQPFELNARHFLALAYLNSGEYEIALNHFNELIKIVPDDYITKYYLSLTKGFLSKQINSNVLPIGYPDGVDIEEEKRRNKIILELEKASIKNIDINIKKPEIKEILEWGVFEGEKEIAKKSIFILANTSDKFGIKILKKALLCPTMEDYLKKIIIFLLISFSYTGKLGIVIQKIYKKINVKKLNFKTNAELYLSAYAIAITKAVYTGSNNTLDKLAFSANRVYNKFKDLTEEVFTKEDIATIIIHDCGIKELMPSRANEIFGVKKERFKYLKALYKNYKEKI